MPGVILDPLRQMMRNQLALYAVQKRMFCPMNRTILDIRTAKFLLDADGDPSAYVMSPEAFNVLLADQDKLDKLAAMGYTPQDPDQTWV